MASPALSRRSFLLGTAGAILLSACGSEDGEGAAGSGGSGAVLIPAFDSSGASAVKVAGLEQRFPFALGDSQGLVQVDAPDTAIFTVLRDDVTVVEGLQVSAHKEGLALPYYPLRFTPPEPGVYLVRADLGGETAEAAMAVSAPEQIVMPLVGQRLIAVDTPTFDEPRDVEPICTRRPPCPFHEVTLTEALDEGRPIAFIVATPAFCQTAVCGPELDLLVEREAAYPGVRMVHAEPWKDAAANDGDLLRSQTSEAVNAYRLSFEPVIYFADAEGVIVETFANIWDVSELDRGLQAIAP